LKLPADNRFEETCALLDEPNCYDIIWTPDLIKEVVHDIFCPDTRFYDCYPEGPIFTGPYELAEQSVESRH
jgi:hypothetical protein